MKVLTVSDNVLPQLENASNLLTNYGDVKAVISCGDMPAPYLEYIVSVLNVPLLFVRGNHDEDYGPGHPGGDNLHGHLFRFQGLTFAGLEGSMRYNNGPVQYDESAMFGMVLNLAPKVFLRRLRGKAGIDVMVTHAPPRGIHDLPDRPHQGFRSFNFLINLYRPRYLIHGHVDTPDRRKATQTQVGSTTVININPVKVLNLDLANFVKALKVDRRESGL